MNYLPKKEKFGQVDGCEWISDIATSYIDFGKGEFSFKYTQFINSLQTQVQFVYSKVPKKRIGKVQYIVDAYVQSDKLCSVNTT